MGAIYLPSGGLWLDPCLDPRSRVYRVFNSGLILFGVLIILLPAGAMTQIVIELELNQFFGKRRVKKMIQKLEHHFIVCGFGRVGRGAAEARGRRIPRTRCRSSIIPVRYDR